MRLALAASLLLLTVAPTHAQHLYAAVVPPSRFVKVGQPATAFATIINAGTEPAQGCHIEPPVGITVPATFLYQTTDPATNRLTGTVNTPVDIPAGGLQTFMFAFTPTAAIPLIDLPLVFGCSTGSTGGLTGVNTFQLTAAPVPVVDLVALAVPEIVTLSTTATYVAIGLANVGSVDAVAISVIADSESTELPVLVCLAFPPVCNRLPGQVTRFPLFMFPAGGATTIYALLLATGPIPFDPAHNRVFFRVGDRVITSVAVQSLP